MEVQRNLDKFHSLGVQVKVISFASPQALESYREQFSWKLDLFSDSGRQIYKLFSLGRAKPWKIFHPKTVIKFVTLILKGAKIQKSKEDEFQMGGDFLIDASGHLRYIFRSETPDERPTLEELLTACRSVVRG